MNTLRLSETDVQAIAERAMGGNVKVVEDLAADWLALRAAAQAVLDSETEFGIQDWTAFEALAALLIKKGQV